MNPQDESWMALALVAGARGVGLTSPNPAVGAVLVHDGRLLAEGWHRRAGLPHAEVEALAAVAGEDRHLLSQATLFITLEPCSTHGRTPPCVDAILAAGIRRVVWAADDPFPGHGGRARGILEAAGCEVCTGVRKEEALRLIRPFIRRVTTGLPWVTAKAGISLDGRITRPAGEGQWLTGAEARADAMRLRSRCDAILAGAGTVRADDPALTLRGPEIPEGKEQPWRVILTKSGDLPTGAKIFTDEWKHRTLVMQNRPLEEVLRELAAERGVCHVLLEGGGQLHAAAFSAGLVDEVVFYIAPLICGTGAPVVSSAQFAGGSVALHSLEAVATGADIRITGLVVRENS